MAAHSHSHPHHHHSHHKIRLIVACAVLFFLVAAHAVLAYLWGSHALDKHLFSISKVSERTQAITIGSQATITILLVILSFVVQGVAADQIIRRRQTVAALQDSLDAWKGLGAALVALWRGRGLGARLRSRVLIVIAFFAAASVLQITTPSVITVNTANSTTTLPLTVTTMPGDLINLNVSQVTWRTDTSTKTILKSLPLSWNQSLAGSLVGAPAGLNNSVFFSTLETVQNETLVFQDPYAKQFTIGCASIPRHAGDVYNATFFGPTTYGTSSDNDFNSLSLLLQPTLSPTTGVEISFQATPTWEEDDDNFQIGGEKSTKDSPIMFRFDDALLFVPIKEPSPSDFAISSFMFMSSRKDALPANASLGIEPPIALGFNAEVWSWVHNNSLTETQAKNHSFLENGTFTIYLWPIGCALHIQNISAEVLGNNQMARTTTNVSEIDRTNLFARPAPTIPLERSWENLIEAIYTAEVDTGDSADSTQGEVLPIQWLENFFLPLLNGTSLPGAGQKTPTIGERFAAMESTLERLSALAYGLIIQSFRSQAHDGTPQVAATWAAVNGTVLGQQAVVRGKFTINGPQVVIGSVCVTILLLAVLFAVIARTQDSEEMHSDVVRDGGVIDLISLAKGSAVPSILAGGSLSSTSAKHRREVAERTLVSFGNDRLDTPELIKENSTTSLTADITQQPAFPEANADPLELTSKALQRIPYYTTEPPPDTRPWSSTLKPYYVISQVVLLTLVTFCIVFIVIWARHLFDHHLWPVEELGKISQVTSTVAQLWSIGPLLVLVYVVQTISSDKSMRRRQTVAALHDSLGAWGGLGASVGAIWRSARYTRHVPFDVIMVTLLFAIIAVLHITMPTVVTVDTVSRQVPVSEVALAMPGRLLNTGYSASGRTEYTRIFTDVLNTVPYLYESKNMSSVGLPSGLNDTVLYSAPYSPLGSDVVFTDFNASQTSVHCGVVPYSEKYANPSFTFFWEQPSGAWAWNETKLEFNLHYGFDISPTVEWRGAANIDTITGLNGAYVFGGPKASRDAPPTVKFNDILAWSSTVPPNDTYYEYATVGMTYISLRNDSLRLNSSDNFAPPFVYTTNITNWAWVEDPSLTLDQQMARAFNETATVTFYIYPLACSLYMTPITALVRGDGKLISTTDASELRNDSNATPFYRPLPTHDTELQWRNLTDGLMNLQQSDLSNENSGGGTIEFTWLELTLLDRIVNGTGIRSLEDSLAYISTLAYALLVQSYRAQLDAAGGGPDALKSLASSWVPTNVTLNGTQPQLFARIKVEGTQLFITLCCTIVLFLVTLISTYGHASAHIDPVVRDGGVIDILSLMAESSLPAVIGNGGDDEGDGRDGRRVRAERTLVAYSIATLDVPDQLQRRVDRALISSSSKEATTTTTTRTPSS